MIFFLSEPHVLLFKRKRTDVTAIASAQASENVTMKSIAVEN